MLLKKSVFLELVTIRKISMKRDVAERFSSFHSAGNMASWE